LKKQKRKKGQKGEKNWKEVDEEEKEERRKKKQKTDETWSMRLSLAPTERPKRIPSPVANGPFVVGRSTVWSAYWNAT